jgi:hypothetical protein
MACARCDFYLPEDSSSAQLLEANAACSGCSSRSRSPRKRTPPPKATSKQSRVSSTASATLRLLPDPHRAKLNSSRGAPRCQRAGARLQPTASSAHEPSASPGIRAKSHPRSLARATWIHTLGAPAGATLSAFGISLRRFTGSTVARDRLVPSRLVHPKLERQQARALVASEREQHIAEVDRRAPAIDRHLGGRQQQLAQAHRGTDGYAERVTVRSWSPAPPPIPAGDHVPDQRGGAVGAPERSPRAPPRSRRRPGCADEFAADLE